MKSDKEFLEGIYQKAANYNRYARLQKVLSFAAVFLVGVLSLTLILGVQNKRGQEDAPAEPPLIRDLRMPVRTDDGGTDDGGMNAASLSAIKEEAGQADVILIGTIREISRSAYGTAGLLDVISCYKGEYKESGIQIESSLAYAEGEGLYQADAGRRVLVFLTITDGRYLLMQEAGSIFQYDGDAYIRQDGGGILENEIADVLF